MFFKSSDVNFSGEHMLMVIGRTKGFLFLFL